MMSIDIDSIDPNTLPFAMFCDCPKLPSRVGVYFAIDGSGRVQYIGATLASFSGRWSRHNKSADLAAAGCVKIAYLALDREQILDAEKKLIIKFNPAFNKVKAAIAKECRCSRSTSVKNGKSSRRKQRYMCTVCGRTFQRALGSQSRSLLTVEEMVKLRSDGLSLAAIGRKAGISRERVRQLLG